MTRKEARRDRKRRKRWAKYLELTAKVEEGRDPAEVREALKRRLK